MSMCLAWVGKDWWTGMVTNVEDRKQSTEELWKLDRGSSEHLQGWLPLIASDPMDRQRLMLETAILNLHCPFS